MFQTDKELSDKLNSWNPMKADYINAEFNNYSSGPGAALDPKVLLQPLAVGKQTQECNHKEVPYFVVNNVPKKMTKEGLKNICMNYGNVLNVRDSKKAQFFVDFETVNDMERVFTALENNIYGFKIYLGRTLGSVSPDFGLSSSPHRKMNYPENSKVNQVDMENRVYKFSEKKPPRPHFTEVVLVSKKDYESSKNLFKQNDPHKYFLLEDDAHNLEPLHKEKHKADEFDYQHKYRCGRSYVEMSDKTKQLIEAKYKYNSGHIDLNGTMYKTAAFECDQRSNIGSIEECDGCKRPCSTICKHCSIYFCGLECQRIAWTHHRYVCGEKKLLSENTLNESSSSATNSYSSTHNIPTKTPVPGFKSQHSSPKEIIPRNSSIVTLTCVSKSNTVFIRSKTFEDNLKFFKILSEIQVEAKQMKRLTEPPKCGQIVIAQFETQFNRAMVLNKDDIKKINIVFIDFGNLDVKSLEELFEAPDRYVVMPRTAIPVYLKDVPEVYMTDKIRKYMLSYLDNDLKIKYNRDVDYIAEKGVYQVELFDESRNKNYNKTIITISEAVHPGSQVLYREFLKYMPLPVGANVQLVVTDNSLMHTGFISCSTLFFAHQIQKFQKELQKYAESLKNRSYAPRINELCIAKYSEDQKWYRGRCLELIGDGNPTIVFFDYGNIALVSIHDIRRYPTQFSFPVLTADCEIFGLPEKVDDQTVKCLEELIPNGSVIECDHVYDCQEENVYTIKLEKVFQQLIIRGLLKDG